LRQIKARNMALWHRDTCATSQAQERQMPRSDRFLMTVSPPTMDRTAFSSLDRHLDAPHAPFDRAWLMARFAEGFEIRMLREPRSGFIAFQPGRLSWRPILGAGRAIVVHDLRVDPDGPVQEAAHRLWAAVEGFARYYGYCALLALAGCGAGLIDPMLVPRRHWVRLDTGPGDTRLVCKFLSGPMPLPALPRDWAQRAAATGPGLVIQTTGESDALEARADALAARLRDRGVPLRRDLLPDADSVRARAVDPAALFSVLLDGTRLGGAELTDARILRAVAATLDLQAPA
jgi:hypothetical protein